MTFEEQYLSGLDRRIKVVTTTGWVALGSVALVVMAALGWSFAGEVRTSVGGNCFILNSGGIVDVHTPAAGRLTEVLVKPGDPIKTGQKIAVIAQPELEEQIRRSRARLQELKNRRDEVASLSRRGLGLNDEALAQRADFLTHQRDLARQRYKIAEDHRATVAQLAAQELVTRRAAADAVREAHAAELAVGEIERQLGDLKRTRADVQAREREERVVTELEYSDASRELASLESQRTRNSIVVSPFDGRVIEVKAGRGALVTADSRLLSIERSGAATGLDVAMFVQGSEGKKIPMGAEVRMFPANSRKEDHGYLMGSVRRVSDYPSTPESLLDSLGSEDLVRELANMPAPFELRVALKVDKGGYLWSRQGVSQPVLSAGTLCAGEVIVRRERPIGFVIPALRRDSKA